MTLYVLVAEAGRNVGLYRLVASGVCGVSTG